MTKIIRVVFYIRVSTEEQKLHGFSLNAQYEKLKEFCEKHGYKLVAVYKDEGVSGRKEIKKRPQLQQMLKDAQKDMFDLILFIKLDRYFRSVGEYHECQKILDKHNVKWTATEEKYDLTTANGRAFVNMKLTIAELEADQTGERIIIVNDYKVKEGYAITGAVPFGWKTEKTEEKGRSRVVRNKDVEHIVYEALDHFEFVSRAIKTTIFYIYDKYNLPFSYKVLRNTFNSTFLYGWYRDNPNYCESYISKERYDRIQTMLNENIRETKKKRIYLFSNLVRCGNCNTRMTGNYTQPRKKNNEYFNYRCNSKFNRIECSHRLIISEKILEEFMLQNIKEELKKYIIKCEVEETKKEIKKIDTSSIQKEIDRLNNMYQKSRISEEKYDIEYEILNKKMNDALKTHTVQKRNLEPLKKILNSDLLDIYNILDREHKRAFWQSIVEEIIIHDDKSITFTIRENYI